MKSDEELIACFRTSGQHELLEELVVRYLGKVRRMIYPMVLDRAWADDLTQEVFLRAFRGLAGFGGRSRFSTWLYRVAMNTTHSFLARRNRSPVAYCAEVPDGVRPAGSRPELAAMQAELESAVEASLGELPPKLRAAIVLTTVEKIEIGEAARIEGCSREQELQSLLAADAPGKRAALGRLLKADLLVFLSEREKPKPHVEVVVCETQRGLRLCREPVLSAGKPEADADAVTQHVERAAAKQREKIRDICAVPFFVSNDLTYEDDYLKAAYPRLVEETIRGWPGLLTVELEEARAIGREAVIGGEEVRRLVPLYVLGDYRHEGHGDARRGTVRLRVLRGERELGGGQAAPSQTRGLFSNSRRASPAPL